MSIKDTKIENLGISTDLRIGCHDVAIGGSSRSRQRHGPPFRECGHVNGACLVRILVVGPCPSRKRDTEVVFCALERDAHDSHVARRAHDGSWRPIRLVRIVGRTLVARQLVMGAGSRRRVGMERRGRNVRDEVVVEAAARADGRAGGAAN